MTKDGRAATGDRSRLAARILKLSRAHLDQGADQWLEETGRAEPPEAWLPRP